MRDLLVARGVPQEGVRFMHEARNDREKGELFAAARTGRIEVLIGSTEKMGVGTNVQARAIALHHLECPWRPADLAQRDGRAIGQGNLNDEVGIYRYVTESSFDGYTIDPTYRDVEPRVVARLGGFDVLAAGRRLPEPHVRLELAGVSRSGMDVGLDELRPERPPGIITRLENRIAGLTQLHSCHRGHLAPLPPQPPETLPPVAGFEPFPSRFQDLSDLRPSIYRPGRSGMCSSRSIRPRRRSPGPNEEKVRHDHQPSPHRGRRQPHAGRARPRNRPRRPRPTARPPDGSGDYPPPQLPTRVVHDGTSLWVFGLVAAVAACLAVAAILTIQALQRRRVAPTARIKHA